MDVPMSSLSRPRFVNWAMIIALGVTVIGAVNLSLFVPQMKAYLGAQGIPVEEIGNGMLYGSAMGSMVLVAIFCFFIARGSNVARWIWTVFAAYGAVSAVGNLGMIFQISLVYAIVAIALQLMFIAATVLLFMPESGAWFKATKLARKT